MFRPDLYKKKVTDITAEELNEMGVDTLFLDVDNTLAVHHGEQYTEGLEDWLECMKNSGIKLILTSNSKRERVEPFANGLSLPFVEMSLKPLCRGFRIAGKYTGASKRQICVVGDQLFTDVLGAKLYRVKCILLKPILPEDKIGFKIKRYLEKIIFKIEKIGDNNVC